MTTDFVPQAELMQRLADAGFVLHTRFALDEFILAEFVITVEVLVAHIQFALEFVI